MFVDNINISIDGGSVSSTIYKPPETKAIALVSHEPGCGRFNIRNRHLAELFKKRGITTVLYEWSEGNETGKSPREFDPLERAQNLASVILWLKSQQDFKKLPVTLYGSSMGAASALIAASKMDNLVKAVISRNGHLDLAKPYLDKVKSPTFIVVGENDYRLLESNKKAYQILTCPKELVVLQGIAPFMEERKKVKQMEKLAMDWIQKHTSSKKAASSRRNAEFS